MSLCNDSQPNASELTKNIHTHTPEICGCERWKITIPSFRRFMEIVENLFITSEKKRTEKRLAAWFVCSSHSQRANNTSWAWLDGIVVGNRRVHEAYECECVTSACPLNRSLGHETDNREMFPGFFNLAFVWFPLNQKKSKQKYYCFLVKFLADVILLQDVWKSDEKAEIDFQGMHGLAKKLRK